MGRKRDLVWTYFHRKNEKGINGDKFHYEARCEACLAHCVSQLRAKDVTAATTGGPPARTEEFFRAELLAVKDPLNEIQRDEPARIVGKVDELLRHLSACNNVHEAIKISAQLRVAQRAIHGDKENVPPLPVTTHSSTVTPAALVPRTPLRPFNSAPAIMGATPPSFAPPARSSHTPISRPDTPLPAPPTSYPATNDTERPSKYRKLDDTRIADMETGVIYVASTALTQWTQERVELFNQHLCRLMIVCNIAWWAVENPFWRFFFQEWIPGVQMPGRSELSGRVLDREAAKCVDEMKLHVGGKFATGQCDGWKSIVKSSIIAMMLNVEYTPWLTNTTDISREPKTADNLLKIVLAELRYAMEYLKIIVVAWCTDCGGETAKMRRMLVARFKWIVSLDCWAHQINLIVGDMLKAADFVTATANALTVVKWFNNHSLALGLLKATTLTKLKQELSLILPCLTRWTTHYLCVRRLLQLERVFKQLVLDREEELVVCAGRAREAKDAARKVIALLKEEGFWDSLRSIERHLEPLARAANATQSDCARLDVVLVTLASLYFYFSTTEGLNPAAASAVLESLEKRWKKADQDIFILALILNPYIRLTSFAQNSPFRLPGHVRRMAEAAYVRFYDSPPCEGFRAQLLDYLGWKGSWTADGMDLRNLKEKAKLTRSEVNLINVWREWSPVTDGNDDARPTDGAGQLALLAVRILSMVPNSASVERVFSLFGIVQTRHRNRLRQERVRKIVQVKADTVRRFGAAGGGPRRRTFGDDSTDDDDDDAGAPDAGIGPSSGASTADAGPGATGSATANPAAEGGRSAGTEGDNADLRAAAASFTAVAREMMDEAGEETDDTPAPPSSITIDPQARLLKNLFDYPRGEDRTSKTYRVLTDYWKTGGHNLEREMEYHEEEYRSTQNRQPSASSTN